MFALAHAEDRTLRMSTLAGYSNSTLSRLSRAVARLETKNWIRRTPDPTDGRFTLAILTDAGEQKVEQAAPGHEATVNRLVFDSLTTAQTRQLRDISRRITTAIRTQDSWTPPPKATE
ncbi:MarR family transcriptional regulator [Streptomyces griseus]